MKAVFVRRKTRIPKYSEAHKDLFTSLSQKFGAEGEKKINLGKHFSTNYELYTYAFFLGLYNNEFSPIPSESKKVDFSHAIQFWGSKTKVLHRKDFTNLQENMFIALVAKTDIDIVALEKGELDEDDAVKALIKTMESFTNGGLILIKEKLEENPNYFLQPASFLNMILETENLIDQGKSISILENDDYTFAKNQLKDTSNKYYENSATIFIYANDLGDCLGRASGIPLYLKCPKMASKVLVHVVI